MSNKYDAYKATCLNCGQTRHVGVVQTDRDFEEEYCPTCISKFTAVIYPDGTRHTSDKE